MLFISDIIIVIILLHYPVFCQSPVPRDEFTTDRKYYKIRQELTEIPSDIPANAVWVYITHNSITKVEANGFSRLSNCIRLYLNNNHIKEVESGSFNGLNRLEQLDLGFNQVTLLKEVMFQGLETVQEINFYSNSMNFIADNAFANLQNLERLVLGRNNINTLSSKSFSGLHSLKHLLLHENNITSLPEDVVNHLPRPLQLGIFSNPLRCDANLCWLKEEMLQGTITCEII